MRDDGLNRRDFARVSLAGMAGGASLTAVGLADEPEREAVAARRPEETDGDDGVREDELLLAVIRRRYPDPRLHGKVLAGIRRDLKGDLRRSKVLRSFALSNSDEPGFTFAAYRGDAIR
ncbi:MAG: hypothetical protein ACE5KM_06155 [Planctomycetaceae bacterium]